MADLTQEWENAAPVSPDLEQAWADASPREKLNIFSRSKMYFNRYGRPMMEMGGLAGGGLAGAAAGPLISMAGAGLGYGIGKKGADLIESGLGRLAGEEVESRSLPQEMIGSAKDVLTGGVLEGGGQLAGRYVFEPVMKGGMWTFQKAKGLFTKKPTPEIVKRAADMWVAHKSEGDIYAKNAQEAADIEMAVPGLKFTYGQRTYDPKEIRMERAQIRKPGDTASINAEQIASNDEALKAYYQSKFGSASNVDDLLSAMQGKREVLETGVETAKKTAAGIESKLSQAKGPMEVSDQLLNVLKTEKQHTSKAVGKLYDRIPNVDVRIAGTPEQPGLIDQLREIAKPLSQVEARENFPKSLGKALKAYGPKEMPEELKSIVQSYTNAGKELPPQLQQEIAKYGTGETLPFQELRGLRTEVLNEMRTEAAKDNPAKMKRLGEMQKAIEQTIDQLADSGKYGEEIATAYRVASKQWRDYADKFKRGTVGNILQGGPKGEVSKMNPEQMLNAIFNARNVQAADQLIKAVGEKQAVPLVREYATYDLMRKATNPMTGEVDRGKLKSWLGKNRPILSKYGMEGEFKSLEQAKSAVDNAMKAKEAFEKSQAAKALGADVEKVIPTIFSGRGALNSAQTARDLMEVLEGNPAAIQGVKNAFGDYAVSRIQTSMRDIVGNPAASVAKFDALYKNLAPAMRVLYRDSPEQMKALLTMKKAYEIMIRNQRSPFGGGSDTAENMLQTLAMVASPLAQTSRTATAIKGVARWISSKEQVLVDQVITKAIFNPEYAETLEMLSSGNQPLIEMGKKRFAGHMSAMAGLGISSGFSNTIGEEE